MRKINSTVSFRPKPNVACVAPELSNPLDGLSDSLEMRTNSLSFLISGPQTDRETDGCIKSPPPHYRECSAVWRLWRSVSLM